MAVQSDPTVPSEYDRLHVGIVLYDPARGRVLDANGRAESLLGYTVAELRSMTIDEYSANTGGYAAPQLRRWLHDAASGRNRECRWRIKRGDGQLIRVEMHLSPYTVPETTLVLAEVFDVTDHHVVSRRLELFSRLLRHNLRNGVSVVAGHAEHIQSQTDTTPVQQSAETIRRTARDVGRLTDSVKQIERATARTAADRSHRDAGAAVREVVETVRAAHPSADISVEEREPMGLRVGDAFDYALRHAIENAIVHDEGDTPRVTVTVGPSPNTGRVEIRIADTAPPIPDDELDALNEVTDTTPTSHGSGTGLFVMQWCVESLGGELTFERGPDGNVVTIYLPPKGDGPTAGRADSG